MPGPSLFQRGAHFLSHLYNSTFPTPALGSGHTMGAAGGGLAASVGQQQAFEQMGAFGGPAIKAFTMSGGAAATRGGGGAAAYAPAAPVILHTAIVMAGSHMGTKNRNAPVDHLTLALDGQSVFIDNTPSRFRYLTVEIKTGGGHWHKAYGHHGQFSETGMKSCKLMYMGGALHVWIDGVESKPVAARFEVIGA